MLSPGSFPTAWPPSQPTSLTVLSGSLTLPLTSLHTPDLDTMFSRPDLQPRLGPEKDVEVVRGDSFTREVRAGLSDSVKSLTTETDEGCKYFRDVDTLVEETARDVYTIDGDDPLSAVAYSYRNCVITYQVTTQLSVFGLNVPIVRPGGVRSLSRRRQRQRAGCGAMTDTSYWRTHSQPGWMINCSGRKHGMIKWRENN